MSKTTPLAISVTAPTRIDIIGGTLDLWPIHQILPKAVTINFGITLHAQTQLKLDGHAHFHLESIDQKVKFHGSYEELDSFDKLPLHTKLVRALWPSDGPALNIITSAKSPAGAGLGGSSALAVTIAWAILQAKQHVWGEALPTQQELVDICKDVEAGIILAPTGVQDYWGAIKGKLNVIEFPAGQTVITQIQNSCFDKLGADLIVCYSGQSRASAMNNWQIFKDFLDRKPDTMRCLEKMGIAAYEAKEALLKNDFQNMVKKSQEEWATRCQLWPGIETDVTRTISKTALGAGAYLSRVCGAGGGGVMGIFCESSNRNKVKEALQKAGGTILDARLADHGLTVTKN